MPEISIDDPLAGESDDEQELETVDQHRSNERSKARSKGNPRRLPKPVSLGTTGESSNSTSDLQASHLDDVLSSERKSRRSRGKSKSPRNRPARTGRPAQSGEDRESLSHRVSLPRWVIYFQGAMLGIVATTFFIFGLAVGNNTGNTIGGNQHVTGECVVSGAVYFDRGTERAADYGAVVVLIPVDSKPRTRPPADGLRPQHFRPINNDAIEVIRGLGGSVVRADQDGKFETEVTSGESYWLLVISKNQRAANNTIGKQTRAEIGNYFFPIEDLLADREFMWNKIRISGSEQKLQVVTF